jgi:predicted component of type VI protein secretion system
MSHPEKRNKENRTFLHDFANPMSKLALILRGLGDAEPAKLARMLEQAQKSMEEMETIHADFKAILSQREIEDKKTPL